MLVGGIAKQSGPFWSAECEPIGAFTQGTSIADAIDMLRSLIELQVDRDGFHVAVTDFGAAVRRLIFVRVGPAFVHRSQPRRARAVGPRGSICPCPTFARTRSPSFGRTAR